MAPAVLESVYKSIPYLLSFPSPRSWIDYDKEADVLYINFNRPTPASDSELTEDGVIVRKKGADIIGFTVLHASRRAEQEDLKHIPAIHRELKRVRMRGGKAAM